MNIREMHVEVQQATQNLAAAVKRKLTPGELDWILNKAQERFIQSKVKPRKDGSGGYAVDQMDLDAIRPLVVSAELTAEISNNSKYICHLPGNYAYLLSDESRTINLCGSSSSGAIAVSLNVLKLKLKKTDKSSSPYFAVVEMNLGSSTVNIVDEAEKNETQYTGLPANGLMEVGFIRDFLFWHFGTKFGYNVYWERYRDMYEPNTFIVADENVGSLTLDAEEIAGEAVTKEIQFYNRTDGKYYPNRLTPSTTLSTLLRTAFWQPSYLGPLSELSGNKLIVYGDSSFIVSGVAITYVKKARRLSLITGEGSELAEEFHNSICDLAVEYFKNITADPNWQVKLQDNVARSLPIQ